MTLGLEPTSHILDYNSEAVPLVPPSTLDSPYVNSNLKFIGSL